MPPGAQPRWSGRLCKSGAPQCEVVCKECSTVSAPQPGTTPAVEPDAWPAELNMTARAVTQVNALIIPLALVADLANLSLGQHCCLIGVSVRKGCGLGSRRPSGVSKECRCESLCLVVAAT